MALDFAQIDASGDVTGQTVRIVLDAHHIVFQHVSRATFPLLARMSDYYEDASYRNDELPALQRELEDYKRLASEPIHTSVLTSMIELVRDSIAVGLHVEAIAD
jgi:hypothetical protein